jgi:hypothetical protein
VSWGRHASSSSPSCAELSLEPNANPVGKTYQEGLFAQRILATAFEVRDVAAEYARLAAQPTAPASWSALRDATKFGPACPQSGDSPPSVTRMNTTQRSRRS